MLFRLLKGARATPTPTTQSFFSVRRQLALPASRLARPSQCMPPADTPSLLSRLDTSGQSCRQRRAQGILGAPLTIPPVAPVAPSARHHPAFHSSPYPYLRLLQPIASPSTTLDPPRPLPPSPTCPPDLVPTRLLLELAPLLLGTTATTTATAQPPTPAARVPRTTRTAPTLLLHIPDTHLPLENARPTLDDLPPLNLTSEPSTPLLPTVPARTSSSSLPRPPRSTPPDLTLPPPSLLLLWPLNEEATMAVAPSPAQEDPLLPDQPLPSLPSPAQSSPHQPSNPSTKPPSSLNGGTNPKVPCQTTTS